MASTGEKLYRTVIFLLLMECYSSESRKCSYTPEGSTLYCTTAVLGRRNASLDRQAAGSATHVSSLVMECTANSSRKPVPPSIIQSNQFGHLPAVTSLEIRNCKIDLIESYAFSGMSNLQEVRITSAGGQRTSSGILNIDPNSFENLGSLQTLQEISDLGISAANQPLADYQTKFGGKHCLAALRTLDVSSNRISILPDYSFSSLTSLESLNISDNQISRLDDRALYGLGSLTSLSLASNRLVTLPSNSFAQTPQLRELYLEGNSISVLSSGIFQNMDQLLVLNLSRNSLKSDWLVQERFIGLVRLVALDISYNQLDTLEGINVRSLTSLQILNLSHNRLKFLSESSLILPNLHVLLLASNLLEDLHPASLLHLPVLSTLDLQNNNIKSLASGLFSNSSSIQDLNLSKNSFVRFPEEVHKISGIRTLDVGGNRIENLDCQENWNLTSLYGLRLAENRIKSLSQDFFSRIPRVEVLNLGSNQITEVQQDAFIHLGKLSALRLDQNQIPDINGLLTAQSKLRYLNVSSNQLHWFDYAFIPKNLEWLDIHGNKVEEIGNYYELKEGFKLHTLDASNNKIRKISSRAFLSGLRRIYINNNYVEDISANTFLHLQNVSLVDLSYNNIRTIHLASLVLHNKRKGSPRFYLGYNPIQCDCETDYLPRITELALTGPYPSIVDLENIMCTLNTYNESGGSYEQPLLDTPASMFLCNYQAHCFPLCLCCDFFACDCRMQCPDGCGCYHDSTWAHNMIECSNRRHTDIPPLIPMDATTVYLDGNRFDVLESQAFIGRKRVQTIYLNASMITEVGNRTLNGLVELEILHLEDNLIKRITGTQFFNLTNLRELYLQNNRISELNFNSFANLNLLQVLFLHNNNLITFPMLMFSTLPSLSIVSLSNNSWTCQCSFVRELQELTRLLVVRDSSHLECVEYNFLGQEESRVNIGTNISCINSMAVSSLTATYSPLLPIVLGSVLTVLLLLVASSILVFRSSISGWISAKCLKKSCVHEVILSYAASQEEFVQHVFIPNLKSCDIKYRIGGSPSSYASPGRLVILLTREYIVQEWENLRRLTLRQPPVVVLMEELSSLHLAQAPDLNLLLGSCPVIRWSESGFWAQFLFYLPEQGTTPPPFVPGGKGECGYDCVGQNSDSSTSTRSTVEGSGSPRNLEGITTRMNYSKTKDEVLAKSDRMHGMMNPLEHWSDVSDSGYGMTRDHLYQTIQQDHIYHTLEPGDPQSGGLVEGNLEVMLPNGSMVPATLVRNADGRIVPLVHVPESADPHETKRTKSRSNTMQYKV